MVLQEKNDYPLIEFNRKFINLRKIFVKAQKGSHIPIMGYIDSLCTDLIVFLAKKENLEYVDNDRLIPLSAFLKVKYPHYLPEECTEYILNQHENFYVCTAIPSHQMKDLNLEDICLYNIYGFCYFLLWLKQYYLKKYNKNANFMHLDAVLLFFKNLEIPFEGNDFRLSDIMIKEEDREYLKDITLDDFKIPIASERGHMVRCPNVVYGIQTEEDGKDLKNVTSETFESSRLEVSEQQSISQKSELIKNNTQSITTDDPLIELRKLNKNFELFREDYEKSRDLILENQQVQINQNERIEGKVDEIIFKINSIFDELTSSQSILEKQIQNIDSEELIDDLMRPFVDEYTSKLVNMTKQEHNNISYEQEKRKLISSLGKKSWNKLSDKSRTFLITSKFIFNYLIMLEDIIDYSSICLLVTKTLEVELTERFFKNFVKYLKAEYGKDYSQYHTSLLGWDKYNEKYYILKSKKCDLGRITYILGFNKDKSLNEGQHKNNMAKLVEYSKNNLFDNLTNDEIEEKLYQYGSLIDEIRIKYRNPAAHTNKLKRIDAEECFNLIIDVEKVLKKMLDSFNY